MSFKSSLIVSALAAITNTLALITATAHAQPITYTDLYILGKPAGFTSAFPYGGAARQYVGEGSTTGGTRHALLWTPSAVNGIDLHPPDMGIDESVAYGTDGTRQVGSCYGPGTDFSEHAFLWIGSAQSAIDLHPIGALDSYANSVNGVYQAGSVDSHAAIWSGSAASVLDLHPSAFVASEAFATTGIQVVGWGLINAVPTFRYHALYWPALAPSAIDLHPAAFDESAAVGVRNGQQVGWGSYGEYPSLMFHALLWTGTAASVVDLHPSGFTSSSAVATSGTHQVGIAWGPETGGHVHAFLWTGTAASAVDLHAMLPGYFANSYAQSIIGNLIYGTATDDAGNTHAIMWTIRSRSPLPRYWYINLLECERR